MSLARSGIYEIRNIANGKRYVGSAVDFRVRFGVHRHYLRQGKHHSRHLQAAWNKYGEAAFVIRPLLICSKKDLLFFEQRAMDVLHPEYNICLVAGSALGVRWSEEARAKCSERQRDKPNFLGRKHTQETLALMSAAKVGRASPTKGRKRPADAVAATASAHRGMKRSEETRRRISASLTGKKHKRPRSPETCAKLSAALSGRRLSPETIARISAAKRGRKLMEAT